MANPDGIIGIGGDREFMNHLYIYNEKLKDFLKATTNNTPEDELKKQESEIYIHYLKAIEHCLLKIRELENLNTQHFYLDWLRWNIDVIFNQLLHYKMINVNEDIKQYIDIVMEAIRQTFNTHFQLDQVEKAISYQYVQAYQLISRSGCHKKEVIVFTGNLFINYVNLLKKRYYIEKLDREDVTFAHLNAEADLLIKKLKPSDINPYLATQIEGMKSMYADFRSMDDLLRKKDDENIKTGLDLAHQRATETFIESVRRQTYEAISQVHQKLLEKMNSVWKAAIVILDPMQSWRSITNVINHPIESIVSAFNWAKQNPWKCAGIVLEGIAIGVAVGIAISYAAPTIMSSSLFSLISNPASSILTHTLTAASQSIIGSAVVAGIGGGFLNVGLVGGNIVECNNLAKGEIELRRNIGEGKLARNEEKGRSIANQYLKEVEKREFFKKQNMSYENYRRLEQDEQELRNAREIQLEGMSPESLSESQRCLYKSAKESELELQRIKEDISRTQNDASQKQSDILKVKEGMEALFRLMDTTYEETSNLTQ